MTDESSPSSYDGLQRHVRDLTLPELETWQNEYPDRDYTIRIEIPEFTCVCPKTGLPDFARLTVEYIPGERCVELKSLKMYLLAFRDVGIFHEHVVNRLRDDLIAAVEPRSIEVRGDFGTRGGINTTVSVHWPQDGADSSE